VPGDAFLASWNRANRADPQARASTPLTPADQEYTALFQTLVFMRQSVTRRGGSRIVRKTK
jgi:hypothetical protein